MAKNKTDRTERVSINGSALKEAIKTRGLSQASISRELGCGCGISNAIMRGYITKPLMMLLKNEYGITLEELQQYSEVNTEKPKADEIVITPEISDEQWSRLGDVIKNAVLEAMKEYI